MLLSNEDITHLTLKPHEFEGLLQSSNATIKFTYTGRTYYNIENLKYDYLTLKLSGV